MHSVSVCELGGEGGTNAVPPSPLPFPLCGKMMGFDKRDCPYGQKLVEATSNMAMFSACCIMKGRCQFSYHLKEDFIIEIRITKWIWFITCTGSSGAQSY